MYVGESTAINGNNGWHGYAFNKTTKGINAPMGGSSYSKIEENSYHIVAIIGNTAYYDQKSIFSNWNRPSTTYRW